MLREPRFRSALERLGLEVLPVGSQVQDGQGGLSAASEEGAFIKATCQTMLKQD